MVFWLFCWHGLTINLGALRWSHGFLWTRFCMWTQTHFIHFIHSFLRKSNDGLSGSPVLKHPESPCMARIYRNSCHRRRRVMWPTLIQEHPLRHRLLVLLSVLPIKTCHPMAKSLPSRLSKTWWTSTPCSKPVLSGGSARWPGIPFENGLTHRCSLDMSILLPICERAGIWIPPITP